MRKLLFLENELDEARRYRIAERLTASPTKLKRGLASMMDGMNASYTNLRDAKKRLDAVAKQLDEMPERSEVGRLTPEMQDLRGAMEALQHQMVAFYTSVQTIREQYKQGDQPGDALK